MFDSKKVFVRKLKDCSYIRIDLRAMSHIFLSLRSVIAFFSTSRYYYFLRTNINCLVTNVALTRNCISYINWMERLNDKRKRFVLRFVNLYIYIYIYTMTVATVIIIWIVRVNIAVQFWNTSTYIARDKT